MATFVPSARMIARQRNVDIASLIDILSWRRAYNTDSEMEFIVSTLDGIDGMMFDECGNRYLRIPKADGSQSDVLWSSHTDSVHSPNNKTSRQNLKWDAAQNILMLNEGKPGQCLGADDGAGLWLMLEMIKEGMPGLYIFHRGEERGGIGSRWIEKNTPELLEGINYAIAFDRKDLSSVITFQGGSRCCSDSFGNSLGRALERTGTLTMKLDTGGSFTDTAVYTDLVAECTNVSVGYYNQHGPRETLDVRHMLKLREAVLQLDPDADFALERKAGDQESLWKSSWSGGYYGNNYSKGRSLALVDAGDDDYSAWVEAWNKDQAESTVGNDEDALEAEEKSMLSRLIRLVRAFPEVAAELIFDAGFDHSDFADNVLSKKAFSEPDSDLAEAGEDEDDPTTPPAVVCRDCHSNITIDNVTSDMRCPFCYAPLPTLETAA